MKTKMKKFWLVPVVLAAAAALAAVMMAKPSEEATAATAPVPVPTPVATISPEQDVLTDQEREVYEQLQKQIDLGDSVGFAQLLMEGSVCDSLYDYLVQEDAAMVEQVLVDAMVQFAGQGDLESLMCLRQLGYASDNCFRTYWNRMGSPVPEETGSETDIFLVHEFHMAYLRDPYAVRSLREMRTAGILDDGIHAALVEMLGFDYMDDGDLEQNQVDTVHTLTQQEKSAYDTVMEAIDQGDYTRIVSGMLRGEVTLPVYQQLMEADGQIMDSVIALGMASLAEEGRFQELVQLCVEGYVSDACYETYWELDGIAVPETSGGEDYLLYELEQVYRQSDNDQDLLRQIWESGLLGDDTYQKLIVRLGIDAARGE